MNGYMVEFKNREASVKECEIVNVLIDKNILKEKDKHELITVCIGTKKQQIEVRNFYTSKEKAEKCSKEYNIKQKIKNENKHICYWCSKELKRHRDITIDHVKPKSKCSSWDEAWNEKNLVISCIKCNQTKDNLNPKLNLHIQRKAELIKYKTPRLAQQKVCSGISSKIENAEYIMKRDSRFYNIKAFFMRENFVKLV